MFYFGFFVFGWLSVHGSCLRKLNTQRKNAKETQLDENYAYIYSLLKNKKSWKIDGKSFALICHFSALILHMQNILVDMLCSWGVQKASASNLPDSSVRCDFMSEWAPSLTAIYLIPELKNEYTRCCASLQECQG